MRALPAARSAARPARGLAVGRRAPDGGDGPGAHDGTVRAAARRAVGRPVAGVPGRGLHPLPADQRGRRVDRHGRAERPPLPADLRPRLRARPGERGRPSPSGVLANGRRRMEVVTGGSLPRQAPVDRGDFAHGDDDAGRRTFHAPRSGRRRVVLPRRRLERVLRLRHTGRGRARAGPARHPRRDLRLLRRARARAAAARRSARRRAADRGRARGRRQRRTAHRSRRGRARACFARRARGDLHRPGRVGRVRARPRCAPRPRAGPAARRPARAHLLLDPGGEGARLVGSGRGRGPACGHGLPRCGARVARARAARATRRADLRRARRAASWTR